MNLVIFILTSFIVISIAFGLWIFKRLSNWKLLDRCVAAFTPILFTILGGLILNSILSQPFWDWNASRLTPSFAIIHGYKLYYEADNGPVLSTVYNPLTAFAYLPATLANSPTWAVISAVFISSCFFFLPILWLHLGENIKNPKSLVYSLCCFIIFCFFTFALPSLSYSAFTVHADAPALGLSAAACAVLYYRQPKNSNVSLLLSSLLAVLAVGTKQTVVPLPFALATYILLVDGRHNFKLYVIYLGVFGALLATIFLVIFQPEPLLFNIITIPKKYPWKENIIVAISRSGFGLIKEWILPGAIILFLTYKQKIFQINNFSDIKRYLSDNRWSMLLMVSLYMMPLSVLNRAKLGGDVNAYSLTTYFLCAASSLMLLKSVVGADTKKLQQFSKLLVAALCTAFIFTKSFSIKNLDYQFSNLLNNPQEVAYNYSKKHPGEGYFPWNPLSTLMAEGKLYHFAFGLLDRERAGFKVNEEHFRRYIPAQIKLIAFPKTAQDKDTLKYVPEFSQQIIVDELHGWNVYTRERSLANK
ncbi:hypothetical protein NDI37_14525 [Funiculus sociatus GB2-A5]|uniref:Glycosyltransferase RgtA/B/C/D-like domain-containing protein n=1 Tax=Funiculus sociatus GB2-A5 TaxID=2933946 RepID=A0ABV0JQK8_9CYAN|nr:MULTISPECIES: hypothetical protein [unclassified Trichocoleus]MBD1905398.1 hypothetical protein [Trichocoleus sp. FACHB-832]MBD2061882.1 hypothetical protein [Trichocoleus sp. FACHB-6]